MWLHMFFRLYLPWQWAHSSLQLLSQPWICTLGNHYGWVDRGSVEYEVLPNTSTHGHHWESNARPSNLGSNALSTWPHAPTHTHTHFFWEAGGGGLQGWYLNTGGLWSGLNCICLPCCQSEVAPPQNICHSTSLRLTSRIHQSPRTAVIIYRLLTETKISLGILLFSLCPGECLGVAYYRQDTKVQLLTLSLSPSLSSVCLSVCLSQLPWLTD